MNIEDFEEGLKEVDLEADYTIKKLSYKDIIPPKGNFLGLDFSKLSSGISLIENGEIQTTNISLKNVDCRSDVGLSKEIFYRKALKQSLIDIMDNRDFDVVVVEDVFTGENVGTSRVLYSINTVIDELIYEGIFHVKKLVRVQSKVWKSWLSKSYDGVDSLKGLNDKIKVEGYLKNLGYAEDKTKGYQDRLDATGMILGYLYKEKFKINLKKSIKKVSYSDIVVKDYVTEDRLSYVVPEEVLMNSELICIDRSSISKWLIRSLVTENVDAVYYTKKPIFPGTLANDFGFEQPGTVIYIAFYCKLSRRCKYE